MIEKAEVKIKYRKKKVLEDKDCEVIIKIPEFKEGSQKSALQSPQIKENLSADAHKDETKNVLELFLPTLTFCEAKDIKEHVISEIERPAGKDYQIFISPIEPKIMSFITIETKRVKTEVESPENVLIVKRALEMKPRIEFKPLKKISLKPINSEISLPERLDLTYLGMVMTPSILLLRYSKVMSKEMSLRVPIGISLFHQEASTGTIGVLEFEDPFEKVFGAPVKLVSERPIVIFAEKPEDRTLEYLEFLKRILREIYRVRVGGLPSPTHVSTRFEEVRDETKASGSIYVVDVDRVEPKEKDRVLQDKLKELYSQNFGFLVFYGSKDNLGKVRDLWEFQLVRDSEDKTFSIFSKLPRFINIKVQEKNKDLVFKLVSLFWGHLERKPPMGIELDKYAVTLESDFYGKIERFANYIKVKGKEVPTGLLVEPNENETILHYALKGFIVEFIHREKGVPIEKIFTEKEFGDIKIDVFVNDEKLGQVAIEIETLYGTCIPLIKLRKTAESRAERGLRTWIVIPNPQLMIYLKDVLTLREYLRKKYGNSVEFYTLDVENNKLISIKEFVEKIREGNNRSLK